MADEDLFWDGPVPSKEEQNSNQNWMVDHLVKYPTSIPFVAVNFPKVADKAKAIIEYGKLLQEYKSNLISPQEYERRLNDILPLIDISEDI